MCRYHHGVVDYHHYNYEWEKILRRLESPLTFDDSDVAVGLKELKSETQKMECEICSI